MILPKTHLTPSGRPQLEQGEVERMLLDKVDIEFEGSGHAEGCDPADRYQNGYAILTSQRVIWIDATATPSPGRSCYVHLQAVHSSTKRVAFGFSPKVRLELQVYKDAEHKPCPGNRSVRFGVLFLRCRGSGPDTFKQQLEAALQQLQRQQEQQLQQQQLSSMVAGAPALGQPPYPASRQQHLARVGSAAPPAAAYAASQQAVPPVALPVDITVLDSLTEMGFPRQRALRALQATRGEGGVQAVIDWMLAFGDTPGVDDDVAAASGVGLAAQPYQPPGGQFYPGSMVTSPQPAPPSSSGANTHTSYLLGGGPPSLPPSHAGQPVSGRMGAQHVPAPGYSGGGYSGGGYSSGTYGGGAYSGNAYSNSSSVGGYGSPLHQQQQQQGTGQAAYSGSATPPGVWPGAPPAAGPSVISSGPVGVAAIMQREQNKTNAAGRCLDQAFQDLNALMAMAQEMVALAERFRGVMDSSLSSVDGNAPEGELLLDAETQQQLIAMGIPSPVTKATAGSRYLSELSRQLADFLVPPLDKAGGLMLLHDVYCLFNRARGTELVSPDDLLAAAERFPAIGVGLRLRRFDSGVLVVQGAQHNDDAMCRRIGEMVAGAGDSSAGVQGGQPGLGAAGVQPPLGRALSASDVAVALGLPLTLAAEALLVAEGAGVLCRDDGPEGLRFFRNFFRSAQPLTF